MKSMYYDRKGQPIDTNLWSELFNNKKYQVVQQTTLSDGTFVSTVWLGLNHGWHEGPPIIFESMVFKKDREEEHCERYATEKEALTGHQRLVKEYWPSVKESHSRWDHVMEDDNGNQSAGRSEDPGDGIKPAKRAGKNQASLPSSKKRT